jgi:hypothetical protein
MTAMGNTGINPARGPWSQGKRIVLAPTEI